MRKWQFFLFAFLLSAVLAVPAAAQTQITSAVIQGTVLDATGALVPGAQVEAKNLETNFVKTATTDSDGHFVFLQVMPGPYTVTVTKNGFAKLVQENIHLTVGQTVSLSVNLKVAAATETVTVTATPTIDTVKTENSTTLNQLVVSQTPVLGRKFEDLLTLTPGVSIVQGPDGDEITFSGQRGIFNNISLDGGDYINGFFGEQVGGQRAPIDIPLDAIKEFQVVANSASAEFGRTAGGVVNVITKSGTNNTHGSIFHFQRHRKLSSDTSDGKPLTGFHREQFGGTVGGALVKDRAFYFASVERITGNLERSNLSTQLGSTACPLTGPALSGTSAAIATNGALIDSNADCSRLALIDFMNRTRSQAEGLPIRHPQWTTGLLGKLDWNVTPRNQLAVSFNFNAAKKVNETFDVATYGDSANGIEGNFSKISVFNVNLFSAISTSKGNEFHYTYSREKRPRAAVPSNIPADTAMGFATTFRFGAPFFLNPTVDELFQRHQLRDNFSWVFGRHTVKFGAEWIHSNNDQVFRGFFTGRYLFGSVQGFLRYASVAAAGGFGPGTQGCSDGTFVTAPTACVGAGVTNTGTPLLLFLQAAGLTGPATDAAGASNINNDEPAFFIQDKWQITRNFTLNYGLRWEAQILPNPTVAPSQTAYAFAIGNAAFPSDGTLPDQKKMFQPRIGFAWDIGGTSKSVLRASYGIYNGRQNMLSQVGSITTNGVQQQTIAGGAFANPTILPTWPNLITPPSTVVPCVGTFNGSPLTNPFPCFSGIRAFDRNYANPRVYTANAAFEQEIAPDWSAYVDYTHSKGIHMTRFLNLGRLGTFAPFLGDTYITTSRGKGLYDGVTIGMKKRFSKKYQLEWNYVIARDRDDDSNERDPFTDRSFSLANLQLDYANSDRDIRHKFNFFTYAELPWGFEGNVRIQARSAQPCSPGDTVIAPCNGTRTGTNRNSLRKDNKYFSMDWRLQRPFKWGDHYAIVPMMEMFNTFNNDNNVNSLSTPALFNFDGFLRLGVGDPRQLQLAVRFTF